MLHGRTYHMWWPACHKGGIARTCTRSTHCTSIPCAAPCEAQCSRSRCLRQQSSPAPANAGAARQCRGCSTRRHAAATSCSCSVSAGCCRCVCRAHARSCSWARTRRHIIALSTSVRTLRRADLEERLYSSSGTRIIDTAWNTPFSPEYAAHMQHPAEARYVKAIYDSLALATLGTLPTRAARMHAHDARHTRARGR